MGCDPCGVDALRNIAIVWHAHVLCWSYVAEPADPVAHRLRGADRGNDMIPPNERVGRDESQNEKRTVVRCFSLKFHDLLDRTVGDMTWPLDDDLDTSCLCPTSDLAR